MAREGQRQLNVFLSEESFDSWRRFADEHDVTVTALVESFGLSLDWPRARLSPTLRQIITAARRIDTDRRRARRSQ